MPFLKADGLEDGYKVLADFNGTVEQMTEIYRCCADSVDGDFFELTGEQVLTLCIQPRNGSPQIFKSEVLSAASSTGHLTPSQPDSAVSNAFLRRCLAPGFSCDCPRF